MNEVTKLKVDLRRCQDTVKKLTIDKQILMDELFTFDPNNSVLQEMQKE